MSVRPERSEETNDQRRIFIALGSLLVAVTVLLYLPTFHHDFLKLWDDDAYVTDNPHVRTGLTLANIRWAFTSFEQSNWHPVAWVSHMIDCQLFGLNPGPQHAVNLFFHAANVLLLFWILQSATHIIWRSFLVALIFAVHPLNVETVAWIAQRKSLLSAFFSLITLAGYGWFVRRGGWSRYLLLALAFAMALLAKPMAVSLPLLLLLFDLWPLRRYEELPFLRRWSKLAIEKIPLFALSAASSVLTSMAQGGGGSVMGLSLLPLATRVENTAISYVAYVGKILWPARLATYYPLQFSPPAGDAIASGAILVLITGLVFYFRRAPYLIVGWLVFLISMIPVIGIVQVGFQGMADRYTYIPAIGLMIAIVWGLAEFVQNAARWRAALLTVAVCWAIALSIATVKYLSAWQNSVTLFAHARAAWAGPDMWLEQLYGNALFSAGRVDEALNHYEQSCAIQPRTEYCHYNIAHIFSGRGQWRDALREYGLALQYTANPRMALLCLIESGEAQMQLGDLRGAEREAAQALQIDPSNPAALQLQSELTRRKEGSK
jgi:hypothetical protein